MQTAQTLETFAERLEHTLPYEYDVDVVNGRVAVTARASGTTLLFTPTPHGALMSMVDASGGHTYDKPCADPATTILRHLPLRRLDALLPGRRTLLILDGTRATVDVITPDADGTPTIRNNNRIGGDHTAFTVTGVNRRVTLDKTLPRHAALHDPYRLVEHSINRKCDEYRLKNLSGREISVIDVDGWR